MAFAKQESGDREFLNRYYQNVFVGEKKTNNYFGPLNPRAKYNEENGELIFLDDQFKNNYLNVQSQPEAFDLHEFWFKKIVEKSNCPDTALGENLDYIRYLYRLLSISYLFESMKLNHKMMSELGGDKKFCSLRFDDVFGSCKPQTEDMKKFHERVYGKFINEISKINISKLGAKEVFSLIEGIQHSTSLTIDPVHARLHDWCYKEKKNCRNLSVEEVKKALGAICNSDSNLIQNICSEKDNLFGLSYAEISSSLIQTSNAFNLINNKGMGEDCLRRYVKIFTPQEIHSESLNRLFPLINSFLSREKSRYLQGELFLPGALKEFDMKGLSDFLAALKPPKVEVVTIKILPKVKTKPPEILVLKSKVVEVVKPVLVKPEIIPPTKPKLSEFENAIVELKEKKLESLSIDMDNFRDDFEFTNQMISDLAIPIKKFQTRTALKDMLSYDLLGSAEAPVGLIFLKYLIDTENHQGLFNIVTILGSKFFVSNDIEKLERPVYIELRNDESTKNHWQIILLRNTNVQTKK